MIPPFLVSRLEAFLREQLVGGTGAPTVDFSKPEGEPALAAADSVSWRVFRNPVALYLGGIAAVLMELAEPRVRSGVWDHTTFRSDPLRRMRRTGMAAMVTVYGARSVAGRMIEGVGKMHSRIEGVTPGGIRYRADDPVLLRWVHATALFGFMEAYHRHVRPLPPEERDRFVAEGVPAARLYGAIDPPASEAAMRALFEDMQPGLERSEIVFEFLEIIGNLSLFPPCLRPLNRMMVRAAVQLLPAAVKDTLGLGRWKGPSAGSRAALRVMGSGIEHLRLDSHPAAQACCRLGLPADYLCRREL
ncbi:oxygenase MpaB family protein [Luteolibacter marinus]|uniref:oxygenase MpaB family protein n=1 Tax=Luteolibacter marinus TaxID=2776705 RepID=UPI0018670312|nr:oxygenase MpaB family protein [Luteolibacter marinus]